MEAQSQRIRDLFGKGGIRYQVPQYQRGFEWGRRNFEDLWTDLQRIGRRVSEHYLGNIILLDADDESVLEIVDGQQRMVTISVLLAAIREMEDIDNHEDRRIDQVLNCYPRGEPERRLHLYDKAADEDFEALWNRDIEKTGGKIKQAFDYYRHKLNSYSSEQIDELTSRVVNDLRVVETRSEEQSLAYMVFQSQNYRGIEVAPETLVKARIFGEADRLDEEDSQRVKTRWVELYSKFAESFNRPRFQSQFRIRRPLTHLLLNTSVKTPTEIDKSGLYRNFDKVLQSSPSVVEFVNDFDSQADHYMQIASSDYDVAAQSFSKDVRRQLQYLNAASNHGEVLTLAILDSTDDNAPLAEYFHHAAVLPMRMELAGENTKYRRTAVCEAARRIRRGGNISQTLIDCIEENSPTDGEIIESIKANSCAVRGAWRFRTLLYLVSIEEHRRGGALRVDLDKLDVEHIAPRNTFDNGRYSNWRRDLDSNEFTDHMDKLGNLTLLDRGDHAGIDETSFNSKRRAYANSDLAVTEGLPTYNEWTTDSIRERTAHLADELTAIWSV